jgi:outer membrane protein assembly factor BamB
LIERMPRFATYRLAAVLAASLFGAGCSPEPPPANPTGHTEAPLWHATGYRIDQTPVLGRRFVFAVATATGQSGARVVAFDRSNGGVRWRSAFAADRILGVSSDLLYVEEPGTKRDRALDAQTGAERPFGVRRGLGDLAAANAALYATTATHALLALTPTGRELWHQSLPVDLATRPETNGATVYVYGTRERDDDATFQGTYAFASATGALRWKSESLLCAYYSAACRSTVNYEVDGLLADNRNVYVSYRIDAQAKGDTIPIATARLLVARDGASGVERWRRELALSCDDAPALVPPDGIFTCENQAARGARYAELDRNTGATRRSLLTTALYADDVVRDGSLFVADRSDDQALDEAGNYSHYRWLTRVDLRTGKELWRSAVQPAAEFTTPAAAGGLVVVGSTPFPGLSTSSGPIDAGSPDVGGLWAWRYGSIANLRLSPPPHSSSANAASSRSSE